MTTRSIWRLAALAVLALGACATNHPDTSVPAGKVTAQMRSGSEELRTYRIQDWIAPDDRTVIITGIDRSLSEGRFSNPCRGLSLSDTIAFVVPTPPQADRFTGVVLPNGTQCRFSSLERLVTSRTQ